jgi:type I restriction enzyme S subunit
VTTYTRMRRFVVDACDGPFGSAIASEHYTEKGARVIRLGNIGSAEWLDEDRAFIGVDYWRSLRRHHAAEGDLVVAALGDQNNPVGRATAIPNIGPALVKADCHRLRLHPDADPRFLSYYLSSDRGRYEAGRMADGSTRKRLTLGKTLGLPVPDFPGDEQRAIADFLDAETAHIDALIAKKRRLAELLEARLGVELAEEVTGRMLGTPVRSSKIGWLGDIPTHWRIERLKFVARLESGHTPARSRPELWENCTMPWITLNDVGYLADHEFVEDTVNKISEAGLAASSARVLPTATVVLSRDATVGRCGILARPMATSQHFVAWVCSDRLRPRYLWLLFKIAMQSHLDSLTAGATLRTIGMPDVGRFVIPIPPLEEQDRIISVASGSRASTESVLRASRRQIDLLSERRQALITAAVTGELDIPGMAA